MKELLSPLNFQKIKVNKELVGCISFEEFELFVDGNLTNKIVNLILFVSYLSIHFLFLANTSLIK